MSWRDRIAIDPKVLTGQPVIREMRIAVELNVECLAEGSTNEQILASAGVRFTSDCKCGKIAERHLFRGEKS